MIGGLRMKLTSVDMFFRESPAKRFKGFRVEEVKTPLDLPLVVHRPVNGEQQFGAESGEWHVSEYRTASRVPNISEPKKLDAFNSAMACLREGLLMNGVEKKAGRLKREIDERVRRVLEERGVSDFKDTFIEVDCLTLTDLNGRIQTWPCLNYEDGEPWFTTSSAKIVNCSKKQFLKELDEVGWGKLK